MCLVQKVNIFSHMQVKNKPCDREMEHAFILGSMDSTVANSVNIGCIPPMSERRTISARLEYGKFFR